MSCVDNPLAIHHLTQPVEPILDAHRIDEECSYALTADLEEVGAIRVAHLVGALSIDGERAGSCR
ncbi:Uncharacterised protein [Trueperella pyogenes]|nr:Uncharacterised protein [Trueperella pyogenes]